MAVLKARRAALGATALVALGAALAAPAGAVTINDNYTPAQAVDPTNITGVGEMVVDQGDGFIGLCTTTLINPRTVILAAHCVNEAPASAYGSNQGGIAIGVGFQANNRGPLINWLFGGHGSSTADQFYNGSYVTYNQHSLDLGPDNNFLQGDVALIAFDTPVTGVPTMDLLFSPLDSATHVTITGYGGNGTGTSGSDGSNIDFKRRIAENTLSVLGSLDDLDNYLFGQPDGLPQNLYQIDFNDPKFGTAAANPYDFDVFGDKALTKEGVTAPGDSGGPLIVDQKFSKPVVAGVLSLGDRFFNEQPGASYGSTSGYQPLYLFWDWIVANNPYKYVSAKSGDGSWTDPNHWVINLDPIYQTIGSDGQLVNALPTTPAAGIDGTSPKFGNICDGANCLDLATGTTSPQGPDGTPQANSASGNSASGTLKTTGGRTSVAIADLGASASATTTTTKTKTPKAGADGSFLSAQGVAQISDVTPQAVVPPVGDPPAEGSATVGGEVVQGAPGSSGFVPQDTDGDITTGAPARYYDVTLSADGTTTLSGADVVIDRFTLDGLNSGLTIDQGANLASLIDTTVGAGVMTVNGGYVSVGDFNLIGGLLQGTGTVRAPYLTSLLGAIAPGTVGGIGTLTVQGNLILSSGSKFYVDIDSTTSDKLVVQGNPLLADTDPNGVADLGGLVAVNVLSGYRYDPTRTYTILTAAGGLMDHFDAAASLSAILYPVITQTANTVSLRIAARPYSSVIDTSSVAQSAYASLLDRSRTGASENLQAFYGQTDLLSQSALRSTLETAAPFAQQTETSLVRMQDEALAKFYRDRASMLRSGDAPETLAVIGQPLGLIRTGYESQADIAMGLVQNGAGATQATDVRLPEGVSAFVAGGYLDGKARPLPNPITNRKEDLSGWYASVGIEKQIDDRVSAGLSAAYSHGKANSALDGRARTNLFELSVYANAKLGGGAFVSVQGTGGLLKTFTRRAFPLGALNARLDNGESAPVFSGEATLGYDLAFGAAKFTPLAAFRASRLQFDGGAETGGVGSLTFDRRFYDSFQGRVGGEFTTTLGSLRPHLTAAFVHDFKKRSQTIQGHFTGATGAGLADADFGILGRDRNYGEVGGGLTAVGKSIDLSVSADTVFSRQDLNYQVYRGAVTFHF